MPKCPCHGICKLNVRSYAGSSESKQSRCKGSPHMCFTLGIDIRRVLYISLVHVWLQEVFPVWAGRGAHWTTTVWEQCAPARHGGQKWQQLPVLRQQWYRVSADGHKVGGGRRHTQQGNGQPPGLHLRRYRACLRHHQLGDIWSRLPLCRQLWHRGMWWSECGVGGGAGETKAGPEEEVADQSRARLQECPYGPEAVLLVSQYYYGQLCSHIDMYYPHTAMEPRWMHYSCTVSTRWVSSPSMRSTLSIPPPHLTRVSLTLGYSILHCFQHEDTILPDIRTCYMPLSCCRVSWLLTPLLVQHVMS